MGKADLTALLETDARARDFYLALPADVRGRISRDPGDIGSFADLRARAARAARGRLGRGEPFLQVNCNRLIKSTPFRHDMAGNG